MSNVFGTALVNVTNFTNVKNPGKKAFLLRVISGSIPSKSVISEVIATSEGFEPGKNYLVNIMERESDPVYGRQFSFNNFGEIKTITELMTNVRLFGAPVIVNVDAVIETPVTEEDPKPKTEKVK